MIVACAAWIPFLDDKLAEVARVAVHPAYSFRQHTTHTAHWFMERGFELQALSQLPVQKQDLYNYPRNSNVLIKQRL